MLRLHTFKFWQHTGTARSGLRVHRWLNSMDQNTLEMYIRVMEGLMLSTLVSPSHWRLEEYDKPHDLLLVDSNWRRLTHFNAEVRWIEHNPLADLCVIFPEHEERSGPRHACQSRGRSHSFYLPIRCLLTSFGFSDRFHCPTVYRHSP